MIDLPDRITSEEQLDDLLSRPGKELVQMISRLEGDIIFLGVAGKIGPSLARMAKRACDEAGVLKRIIGVSRFRSGEENALENYGIEIIKGDLLDLDFISRLPLVKNVFYLAGMKFGSEENLPLTWAMNTYLPAIVADYFKESRIVAYSTGCVYPLVPVETGGSIETDVPLPVGEYAQSCLGRERMFEYGSSRYDTQVALIRLNYAVEMRYGVLVDIALKVKNEVPVDLSMGYFNVIWQGDANDFVLRSIDHCKSPARIFNITGREILSVRVTAIEFGKLLGKNPKFVNTEEKTALLSNSAEAYRLFGFPKVQLSEVIKWTAGWVAENRKISGKPTHFEVRNGKY